MRIKAQISSCKHNHKKLLFKAASLSLQIFQSIPAFSDFEGILLFFVVFWFAFKDHLI